MKRSSFLLYCGVWCASIALSFFIGRSLSSSSANTEQSAVKSLGSAQLKAKVTAAQTEPRTFTTSEGDDALVALEQLQDTSAAMTRDLLNAALALPMSDPGRSNTINDLLKQLAATDPLAALDMANGLSSLRDAERARNDILEVWASNEPMAALAWANTELADVPANLRDSQMQAIMRGFAETNPKGAFDYANALSEDTTADSRLKNRLLSEVIETQIRAGGVADAQATIALMPDGSAKDNLQRELVNEWARFDPASAADYVDSLGSEATTRMKTTLVEEWAENDPAAAAAWLGTLATDDPAYAQASSQITREWTRYDLTASSEWLNSLPASPELDRAVATYTMRAAQEDPSTAMSWAESITSDNMRSRMMQQVAANWKNDDPDAFTTYLDDSDLSTEERAELENAKSWDRGGRDGGGRGGPGGGGGGGGRGR
ncbi:MULTISPECIES: hypothetical protein [unclassified Lentimonas]|uniref:hypothetical protein n=1 Tax=unclassified Lentimonas TaxID=2630993 RepID=UPI00132A8CF2|nr:MULTISPECIES: hypothetical protein [unclassified Lentimonas]CAA6693493.1 Unannotated [Lentimonas sp. CC19]CAA6695833.1 Unannotated [Lentimonas sp. CC10]CAA7069753.1 Unannotated [Lentimonas sp. CC11]